MALYNDPTTGKTTKARNSKEAKVKVTDTKAKKATPPKKSKSKAD